MMLYGQGFLVYIDLAQAIPKHPKIQPATAPPAPPSSHLHMSESGSGGQNSHVSKTKRGGKKRDGGGGRESQ